MRLGELIEIRKGKKPLSIETERRAGYRRLLQIDDLRAGAIAKYCPPANDEVNATPTDVIIAWDGANAATSSFGLEGVVGSTLAVLRPTAGRIHTPYLGHFMRAKFDYLRARCKGATVPHLDGKALANLDLPLPAITEQRRIATVLERTAALLAKRGEALVQIDALSQSIFLNLFGDPVRNPMRWRVDQLGNIGTLDRGVSKHRPRNAPDLLGGPYPLVQTGEVANCDGYIRHYSSTYSELGLRQSKLWPAGTLCITIAANIAKAGILKFASCFPDSVVGFRSEEPATVEFVRVWLSFLQKSLEENAPESAQKNINLAILRSLEIPIPPIELQREFARRVAAVERLRSAHRASLAELDALFASLRQRAFQGEL